MLLTSSSDCPWEEWEGVACLLCVGLDTCDLSFKWWSLLASGEGLVIRKYGDFCVLCFGRVSLVVQDAKMPHLPYIET